MPTSPGIPSEYNKSQQQIQSLIWSNEAIKTIADKHKKTVAQILLKVHVARGISVIPKTVKKERLIENSNIFDFELDTEDWTQIKALDSGKSMLPDFWLDSLKNA